MSFPSFVLTANPSNANNLGAEVGAVLSRRATCARCLRPQSTCICQWITPTLCATEVLILQHPLEVHHAKNSARLLHLSLPRSRLVVGEVFDAAALQAAMPEPKYTVLLYPPTASAGHLATDTLEPARLDNTAQLRVVVLDATWRKSRKMLHQSPILQRLPRLSLVDAPPSAYLIRKAHQPGQLSTLEATCAALAQLEGASTQLQALLQAFDSFVSQRLNFSEKCL
jgi:DTW domain-containing protein YfiP